jgi:hypothetical protein
VPCVAKGYEDAVALEQHARCIAYLNLPETVCGFKVKNITPLLHASLISHKTPFLLGGSFSHSHVAQFICLLSVNIVSDESIDLTLAEVSKIPLEQCSSEIDNFINLTFMDAPKGGKASKSIASATAWMVYRFRGEPFRMERQEILNTPYRILYQEMRCWEKEEGANIRNESDKLMGNWLQRLQDALDSGKITQEQLDEFNARNRE